MLMAGLGDPNIILSFISVIADVCILALLYLELPRTEKTGYLRYLLRFGLIWAIGDLGTRLATSQGSGVDFLRVVSELVRLMGMAMTSALWVHLAWLSVLDLKDHDQQRGLDKVQMAIYVVAVIMIAIGIFTRDGFELLTSPGSVIFQVWFLVALGWSAARFTGPGYDGAPAIEKRSRSYLAAGTISMFFFVLVDLLQGLTLRADTDLSTGLSFVPLAVIGYAFLLKRKFIIAPAERKAPERDSMKASKGFGGGITLNPGKVYVELDRPSNTAIDVVRAQCRRGRPVLVITNRDPARYRKSQRCQDVPVSRFVSEDWDDPSGLDITSDDELEMLPLMASDFGLECWQRDPTSSRSTGCVIVIDGADVLAHIAERPRTKALLRNLRKVVHGSDQLRVVITGDRAALGARASMFEKAGKALAVK